MYGGDYRDFSGNGNDVLGYRPGTSAVTGSGGGTIPATAAVGVVLPAQGQNIIANDGDGSLRVRQAATVTVPSVVMNPGRERETFTLEAWFKPEVVTSEITVFGRAGESDGILYDGDGIHFVTVYSVSGECRASYYPQIEDQVFHVVGVHEPTRNLLYVNGVLVDYTELTDEQLVDLYSPATVANTITSGTTALTTNVISVDGLAIYTRSLAADVVESHYYYGTRTADSEFATNFYGGTWFDLVDTNSKLFRTWTFDSDEDWAAGTASNTVVSDDRLNPNYADTGLTESGTWLYGDILTGTTPIVASKIEWDVDGPITVETSVNGTTWQAATNGDSVPGITTPYSPDGTTLSVRVTFPAGTSVTNRLNSLSIKLYSALTIENANGSQSLVTVGSATVASAQYPVISKVETAGVRLSGGRAYLTPNVDGTQTVEGWFMLNALPASPVTVFDASSDAGAGPSLRWTGTAWTTNLVSLFVDGYLTSTPTLTPGVMYHLVFNLPASVTSNIYLGSTYTGTEKASLQISSLSTFTALLSATQISELYRSYLGFPALIVRDDSKLTVTDSATPPKLYSYAWSITSA